MNNIQFCKKNFQNLICHIATTCITENQTNMTSMVYTISNWKGNENKSNIVNISIEWQKISSFLKSRNSLIIM